MAEPIYCSINNTNKKKDTRHRILNAVNVLTNKIPNTRRTLIAQCFE